jgi:hypothetical protein
MAATQQSAGVRAANTLQSLMQQMMSLRAQINDFVLQYNDNSWGTLWAAWQTAALLADGSLGAADGSPVVTHPIDTRLAQFAGLQYDRSSSDMTSGVAMLQAFQAFLTNQTVTTANRNAVLDLFQQG